MTNLNLNLYKVFCAVASSKNYAEASEKLNMSESNISNQISNLESQLGIKLFYREKTGLILTEIGKEIYEFTKTSVSQFDYIERIIKEKEDFANATITIGCPSHISAYFLLDSIEKVKKDFPNLKINIYSIPSYKDLINMLKEHLIDMVIIDVIPKNDKSIKIKNWRETSNTFVANKPIIINNIKDMEEYHYILNFENSKSSKDLEKILQKNNVQLPNKTMYDSTELRVDAAKRGVGIAYVMKQAVLKEIERKELYEVKLPITLPKNKVSIIYLDGHLSKVDKKFIKEYLEA